MANSDAGTTGAKPRTWAFKAGVAMAAIGLIGFLYAVSSALSKPEPAGYGRFAEGAMRKLVVPEKPRPQSSRTFKTIDGFDASLASFRGNVVVMNLWATWCPPCVEEMPTLAALQTRYKDRPLKVVAVSLDQPRHRAKAAEDLAKLSGGALTFYHDPTAAIAYDSGAGQGMPTTIIYAKDGREIGRLAGAADWNSPAAHALFDAALAE
jgi:thiol-disulfide isomerase/thioredoxin